ncbi:39S ribosomal protein L18, mitochondrial [Lutzomyia longipalpis]|uniref:39S ribosomal protein L18, mitochondrial n=1 Tax=Lutzomyia longipalpis TaxID=7200 RepID=UPI0024834F0B|nr:39S ribosomal protein L18, mitochondrial [Lutzomyia longipalpis]
MKTILPILRINQRFLSDSVRNRNPVNAELIGVARKPDGYHLEARRELFHNTLYLEQTNNTVTAKIVNPHRQITVLKVSTQEWSLKKNLYKMNDTAAFTLLARVLAERCQFAGITEVAPSASIKFGAEYPKHAVFVETFKQSGMSFIET